MTQPSLLKRKTATSWQCTQVKTGKWTVAGIWTTERGQTKTWGRWLRLRKGRTPSKSEPETALAVTEKHAQAWPRARQKYACAQAGQWCGAVTETPNRCFVLPLRLPLRQGRGVGGYATYPTYYGKKNPYPPPVPTNLATKLNMKQLGIQKRRWKTPKKAAGEKARGFLNSHFAGKKMQIYGSILRDFPKKKVQCLGWCHLDVPGSAGKRLGSVG